MWWEGHRVSLTMWSVCAGPAAAFGMVPVMAERRVPVVAARVPSQAESCLTAGREAVGAGRFSVALEWFDRALTLEPGLGVAHLCRVFCLTALGRDKEAALAMEMALASDKEDARVALELARVHVRANETALALEVLAPALARAPSLEARLSRDPTLRALCDHPAYLQMVGQL